jgi:predicted Zn-dependent peptidase
LILGYKTFSQYDKRRYALDLLIAILGSGAGSVLFREIREKRGLAYAIYIINDYYTEYGNLAIYSGLNKTKTAEALKIIKTEVEKAKKNLFTAEELKRAKEFVKGGYIISLENAKNLSNWYAEREFLDPEKPSPKEILEIFDKITPEEVLAAAQAVFRPEHETLVIVGPFKNEQKFVKILDESN